MADADTEAMPTPERPLPKFFGIGCAKTGSNSLASAMRRLGFRVLHFGGYTYRHPETDYTLQIWRAAETNIENPLTCVADFVTDYDVIIDWPINQAWQQIHAHNPDAKFIVTYRDPHEIAFSCARHNWRHAINNQPRAFPQTYAETVESATEHYTAIFEAALNEPERFLTLSVHDADEFRWRALCAFTKVTIRETFDDGILPAWPKEYAHADHAFPQQVITPQN